MSRDKRIDIYITKAQPFAGPILEHLRDLVHKACPEAEENIKWGMPSFEHKGLMCSMAAFKKHCAFIFNKGKLLNDPDGYLGDRANEGGEAMGQLGRITSIEDLPPDKVMFDFVKQAKNLNEEGAKTPKAKPKEKKELVVPDYLMAALKSRPKTNKAFEGFSPSQKREYVEWLEEAKTEPTREKRLATALEWISEGKPRNWKYLK